MLKRNYVLYDVITQVLGREVYNSNFQLGGIQIMHNNGITHSTVTWDYEGIKKILGWLSYIPASKTSPLPILINPADPAERHVDFKPTKAGYDPRYLLNGFVHPGVLFNSFIMS